MIRFYNLSECFDRLHLEIVIRFKLFKEVFNGFLVFMFHHEIVMRSRTF